ncbi:hypothetical protein MRX96_039345 [Rhipicephalus microplus]
MQVCCCGQGGKNGGAVWLQHSVPRFVDDVTKEYEYPHSGRENGQLFFCTSFSFEAVETIYVYTKDLRKRMNDSITVQSWRNGAGGAQQKYCSIKYSVTDVETIVIRTEEENFYFSTREDHSKWYITRTSGVFCFSTLNRMLSQRKRGGEITCIKEKPLAKVFEKSIDKRSTCRRK